MKKELWEINVRKGELFIGGMISYLGNSGKSAEYLLKRNRDFNRHTSLQMCVCKSIQENVITKIKLKIGFYLTMARKEKQPRVNA